MKRLVLGFLSLLIFSNKAFAWGLKEFNEEISVPFTETSQVTYTGTSLVLSSLIVRKPFGAEFERSEAHNRRFGGGSTFGDYAGQMVPNILYVAYQGIQGSNGDPDGYRRSLGMIKATAYAGLVTTVLKYSFRTPRPTNNNERNSFPSGHSATVFTFAGYVLEEHGPVMGSLAVGLAVFSGYSRIHDHRHRIQEVLAGATIGLAYGMGLSRLQKKSDSQEKSGQGFTIAPIFDADIKGLALYKEF